MEIKKKKINLFNDVLKQVTKCEKDSVRRTDIVDITVKNWLTFLCHPIPNLTKFNILTELTN